MLHVRAVLGQGVRNIFFFQAIQEIQSFIKSELFLPSVSRFFLKDSFIFIEKAAIQMGIDLEEDPLSADSQRLELS